MLILDLYLLEGAWACLYKASVVLVFFFGGGSGLFLKCKSYLQINESYSQKIPDYF